MEATTLAWAPFYCQMYPKYPQSISPWNFSEHSSIVLVEEGFPIEVAEELEHWKASIKYNAHLSLMLWLVFNKWPLCGSNHLEVVGKKLH